MKTPAITAQSLANVAGRKTRNVQKKLHEAEAEMHSANAELARTAPLECRAAQDHNAVAERKVHEAVQELEVVREMLDHAEAPERPRPSAGASGHGVQSMLPHLRRRRT
jgi:hypothetical protein